MWYSGLCLICTHIHNGLVCPCSCLIPGMPFSCYDGFLICLRDHMIWWVWLNPGCDGQLRCSGYIMSHIMSGISLYQGSVAFLGLFQVMCSSSLQMACTCSRTLRGYAVILLLGLARNFTVCLPTIDTSKPIASAGSYGPRRRAICVTALVCCGIFSCSGPAQPLHHMVNRSEKYSWAKRPDWWWEVWHTVICPSLWWKCPHMPQIMGP